MEDYFQRISDCLIAGELEAVAKHYTFPLVVYEPGGIEIHKTAEDAMSRMAERLLSIRAGGAADVRVRLDHVGPLLNDRQPFDVTKTYLDEQGRALGTSHLRYFCRMSGDQILVELIEITEAFQMDTFPQMPAVCH